MMEEVAAFQVRIALLIACADRADIDGGFLDQLKAGLAVSSIKVPVRPLKLP